MVCSSEERSAKADMSERARRPSTLPSPAAALAPPQRNRTGRDLELVPPAQDPAPARPSPRRLRRLLIASDVVGIIVGYALSMAIQQLVRPAPDATVRDEAVFAVFMVPIWVLMMASQNLYLARAVSRFGEELRRLMTAGLMAIAFLVAVLFLAQYNLLSRLWVVLLFVCVTSSLVASRLFARHVFNKLRREGRICRPVVIVGTGSEAVSLLQATRRRPDLGYEVVGFTGDRFAGAGSTVLGSIDDTPEVIRRTGAVGAILSVASLEPAVVNRLTRTLTDAGCHVTLSSSLHDIDINRTRAQSIDGRLMIYVEPTNRSRIRLLLKRTFDVVVAGLAMLLTLPIVLIAAVAIKLETRGPVLFRQVRVGKDGELFEMFKLRSMVRDAEALKPELEDQNERTGPLFKMRDDPRITRVGRVLRATSIDEFPQFWNVLRGDMSVVGPRPALPSEVEQWTPDLRERLRVLPGITGMWQVSGRAEADFELYRRLDLYYVDNWSLTHDLKIVAKTFLVVLLRRGSQ